MKKVTKTLVKRNISSFQVEIRKKLTDTRLKCGFSTKSRDDNFILSQNSNIKSMKRTPKRRESSVVSTTQLKKFSLKD